MLWIFILTALKNTKQDKYLKYQIPQYKKKKSTNKKKYVNDLWWLGKKACMATWMRMFIEYIDSFWVPLGYLFLYFLNLPS